MRILDRHRILYHVGEVWFRVFLDEKGVGGRGEDVPTAAHAPGAPVRSDGAGARHFGGDNGTAPRETPRNLRQQLERGKGAAAVCAAKQ